MLKHRGSTDSRRFWTHLIHVSRSSAAGWPGSRTYRRAYRPPNGLSRIFQGSLESLYGATFNPPVRCISPLISHGQRTTIRSPQGVMRSISKSFRRLHLSVKPYRRSRPYGSSLPSQYNASCAGRGSKSTDAERKPLSDFTVAGEKASEYLTG